MPSTYQGLQFRCLPPDTGGTYWSARLPVRGQSAIGRFHQKSTVDDRLKGEIDRRRSIEGEIDHRRSIEREKGRKKKKRKKKKKKRKEEKKYLSPAIGPRLCAARRSRAVAARVSRALFLPRREKDRGDVNRRREVGNSDEIRANVKNDLVLGHLSFDCPCWKIDRKETIIAMSCTRLSRGISITNKAAQLVGVRGFAIASGKGKKGPKGGTSDAPKASSLSLEVKSTTVVGANILKDGTDLKIMNARFRVPRLAVALARQTPNAE
ncbi:hypothetical protein GW17_00015405 [Ensete ventricosum]|nr:hypothetical protein GW17_00015405 [Ensete ventricosum]